MTAAEYSAPARYVSDDWTPQREAEAKRVRVAIAKAEADVAARVAQRDNLVRSMLAEGVRVATLAEAFGLTRSRVYQIRDGRR